MYRLHYARFCCLCCAAVDAMPAFLMTGKHMRRAGAGCVCIGSRRGRTAWTTA